MSKIVLTNEGALPPPPPPASVALFAQGDALYSINSFGVINQFGGGNVTINTSAPLAGGTTGNVFNLGFFVAGEAYGDILIRGISNWTRLPAGTFGQVLQTNGPGSPPSWVAPPSGSITITTNAPLTGGGTGTNFTLDIAPGTSGALLTYSGGSWGNLPIGSAGQVLTVVGGIPSWQPPSITSNPPVQGAVAYFNGTDWIALSPGAAGQVLVTNGPGNNPSWQNQMAGSGAVIEPFNCGISVNVLDAVYLSASDTVDKADANTEPTMPCIGVVISKPTPITCNVVMSGSAGGFVGLVTGATYYVGLTAGTVTDSVNTYPQGAVVQRIGYARNTTTLVVDIDRDYIVL